MISQIFILLILILLNAYFAASEIAFISLNDATVADLIKLPGIGEAKANDIIAYRNEHGPFENIEDLKNVSGIGENLFAKIKDYLTI